MDGRDSSSTTPVVGLGLRVPPYGYIVDQRPRVDLFEVVAERFIDTTQPQLESLERLADAFPVTLRSDRVDLVAGEQVDFDAMAALQALATRVDAKSLVVPVPPSSPDGSLPKRPRPNSEERARELAERVRVLQGAFDRPLVLDFRYDPVSLSTSPLSTESFQREVIDRSEASLTIDVNTLDHASLARQFDPLSFLDRLPVERLVQVHLAPHAPLPNGAVIEVDPHPVEDRLWELYRQVIERAGEVTTIVEWDADHWGFDQVLHAVDRARTSPEREASRERGDQRP